MTAPTAPPQLLGGTSPARPAGASRSRWRAAASPARAEVDGAEEITTLAGFEALLAAPGPWFGAFDFPFGLPRELVDSLALATAPPLSSPSCTGAARHAWTFVR